jgi:hypothetical protein
VHYSPQRRSSLEYSALASFPRSTIPRHAVDECESQIGCYKLVLSVSQLQVGRHIRPTQSVLLSTVAMVSQSAAKEVSCMLKRTHRGDGDAVLSSWYLRWFRSLLELTRARFWLHFQRISYQHRRATQGGSCDRSASGCKVVGLRWQQQRAIAVGIMLRSLHL